MIERIEDTLRGTRYADEDFNLEMPFLLKDREFEIDESESRNFFSEVLVSTGDDGRWIRVRTVRYPDMDALGIHKNIVKVFVIYSDGYMLHGEESLYDAASLSFMFGIDSGERYLAARETNHAVRSRYTVQTGQYTDGEFFTDI
jgi:hypothetical protein